MSASLADLRAGDIGFGPIRGLVGVGVGVGQLALGEGFRVGRLSIRHVFVVTAAVPTARYERQRAQCVEAMPSGARPAWIGDRWTPDYAYVRLPEDYPGQAADAAAIARAMIGTPYSFASYAALAAWKFGLSTPRLEQWIGRRQSSGSFISGISSGDRGLDSLPEDIAPDEYVRYLPCEAICSVLADQAWSLTGKKVMEGVPHQCVTPGALAARLLEMEGARWLWPGR